jgi:hypothetical protein
MEHKKAESHSKLVVKPYEVWKKLEAQKKTYFFNLQLIVNFE